MKKGSNDFYTIFSKELDECKVEFERHLPKKGMSWQLESFLWLFKAVESGFWDLKAKYELKALPALEDQAVDLINLLLMFIQQAKKAREETQDGS